MDSVLQVKDLKVHFNDASPERFAVNGISMQVEQGEIVGLVGESGSGKTVTAMSICGLLPKYKASFSGSIRLSGREIFDCSDKEILSILGSELGIVFQEPLTALDPVMKIGPQVEESLRNHGVKDKKERRRRAVEALKMAELREPERVMDKYPHELSGGMLQRVMIAAAMISRPKLLLADEPTTALDVSVQAEILELLKKLNREQGMSILLISHDMHVVRRLCSRVIVMCRGEIVEEGPCDQIFFDPQHSYTQQLIAAIPGRDRHLF